MMMFKRKAKNWLLRRQIRHAKRRVHEVANNLYILRHTHSLIKEVINDFLDNNLYPILTRLDEIEKEAMKQEK